MSLLYRRMSQKETIRKQSKIFNLSSSTADQMYNGSANSYGVWTIPNFIEHNENVQHIYFSVSHAEIPNSFYLINQYNNILAIKASSFNTVYYTIPIGNYNVSTLLAKLKTILPAAINITYDSQLAKYTFSSTAYSYMTIIATGSSISRIMGLDKINDMTSTYDGTTTTLVLPYCVNFLPTARLNLRTSSLPLENYHSNDNSNDVFLSLQNNANQGSMILYDNRTQLRFHIDLDNLHKMDIRITDDSNRNMDFNNSAWFITLRIDYEYYPLVKDTTFSKILKDNNGLLLKYLEDMQNDE